MKFSFYIDTQTDLTCTCRAASLLLAKNIELRQGLMSKLYQLKIWEVENFGRQ